MVQWDQQPGDRGHSQEHQDRRVVRDTIEERMQQQVDELEEQQQRDEREVLDGLGAHHRRAAEHEQEDAERDDDEGDDAELDVAGAGGGFFCTQLGILNVLELLREQLALQLARFCIAITLSR
ncbi:MAG: hypothetical protein IPP33_15630 [Flavobacteriales bacterium]|nr:hypothetical protein [Flavobacteriales bacterium]